MDLFEKKDFTSHSGLPLHWKVECDALTTESWRALAQIASELLPPFGHAIGIERGGMRFAAFLRRRASPGHPDWVICDDVLTTGASMEQKRIEVRTQLVPTEHPLANIYGAVAFSRLGRMRVPGWIQVLWQLEENRGMLRSG